VQEQVHAEPGVRVTLLEQAELAQPLLIDGRVVLEAGSPAVWFTFPGAWHDIGRFHRADGTFTGIYGNVLTPVRFLDERTWETTDLFLDVWLEPRAGASGRGSV
jgi:predicted RNA-binding protein associated with RNAse of E/G family